MGHPKLALLPHFIILLKYNSSSRTTVLHSLGKCCNKLPILTDIEDRRLKRVFKKLGLGGYFKVPVVLDSRTFRRCFALDRDEMSSSGGDNTGGKSVDGAATAAGDKGKSLHSRDEHLRSESPRDGSVEYIGTI